MPRFATGSCASRRSGPRARHRPCRRQPGHARSACRSPNAARHRSAAPVSRCGPATAGRPGCRPRRRPNRPGAEPLCAAGCRCPRPRARPAPSVWRACRTSCGTRTPWRCQRPGGPARRSNAPGACPKSPRSWCCIRHRRAAARASASGSAWHTGGNDHRWPRSEGTATCPRRPGCTARPSTRRARSGGRSRRSAGRGWPSW